jgi:phage terminase large subunit
LTTSTDSVQSPLNNSAPSRLNNLRSAIERRYRRLLEIGTNREAQLIELEWCRQDRFHFFDCWPWTYDPREALAAGLPAHQPFELYQRQRDLLKFLLERIMAREDGLVEKSRGVGFTWVAAGLVWHAWRFIPGFKTTFGNRKVEYVDRIGDPDSTFEKIRMLMRSLPVWFLPEGFKWREHDNSCLMINPTNGNTIRGEGGDDMGRGGRSSLYILDEAAFYERADRIDASTSSNSDVRIWASTVNGPDNLFARKRRSMRPDQVFRFHYSDNPLQTPEWLARKKGSLEPHKWASEFEIDYSASLEGVCIPATWVDAAQKIAQYITFKPDVRGIAGGDIGGGRARSVFIARFGPVVTVPVSWGDPDTTETAHRLLDEAKNLVIRRDDGFDCRIATLRYDAPGVGLGVASTLRRNPIQGLLVEGVNTGMPASSTMWPDGETSNKKFRNLKAEIWGTARDRYRKTFETLTWFQTEGRTGTRHPDDELICLPPDNASPDVVTLKAQLSCVRMFRSDTGKMQIESKDELARRQVVSPDHADAHVLTFVPGGDAEVLANFARMQVAF